MTAALRRTDDPARVVRALDRLAEHCDLAGRRAARLEERRRAVRSRLESELGRELTAVLLGGLSATPTC